MKRYLAAGALLFVMALTAACSPSSVFEDVGTDPHPPRLGNVKIGYQPATPAVGLPEPPNFVQCNEYFEVRPLTAPGLAELIFNVQYTDAGGDIMTFHIRDRNGNLNASASPTPPQVDLDGDGVLDVLPTPEFFAGTAGFADLQRVTFPTSQAGPHVLEFWAEDSHESRSQKVTCTVTVVQDPPPAP